MNANHRALLADILTRRLLERLTDHLDLTTDVLALRGLIASGDPLVWTEDRDTERRLRDLEIWTRAADAARDALDLPQRMDRAEQAIAALAKQTNGDDLAPPTDDEPAAAMRSHAQDVLDRALYDPSLTPN